MTDFDIIVFKNRIWFALVQFLSWNVFTNLCLPLTLWNTSSEPYMRWEHSSCIHFLLILCSQCLQSNPSLYQEEWEGWHFPMWAPGCMFPSSRKPTPIPPWMSYSKGLKKFHDTIYSCLSGVWKRYNTASCWDLVCCYTLYGEICTCRTSCLHELSCLPAFDMQNLFLRVNLWFKWKWLQPNTGGIRGRWDLTWLGHGKEKAERRDKVKKEEELREGGSCHEERGTASVWDTPLGRQPSQQLEQ